MEEISSLRHTAIGQKHGDLALRRTNDSNYLRFIWMLIC